ncbi:hypothetical protein N656DRAFT_15760 [Canariomyces notabilis]|uniref:Uncharacterized protein n=1 Tax=Canariomyces notabilis TaxID=2074819 RepID=A0AAN6TME2_9PEZI|nr:hypothetical protein N656DRAFT_15760 [Canariomyces arenarius]
MITSVPQAPAVDSWLATPSACQGKLDVAWPSWPFPDDAEMAFCPRAGAPRHAAVENYHMLPGDRSESSPRDLDQTAPGPYPRGGTIGGQGTGPLVEQRNKLRALLVSVVRRRTWGFCWFWFGLRNGNCCIPRSSTTFAVYTRITYIRYVTYVRKRQRQRHSRW